MLLLVVMTYFSKGWGGDGGRREVIINSDSNLLSDNIFIYHPINAILNMLIWVWLYWSQLYAIKCTSKYDKHCWEKRLQKKGITCFFLYTWYGVIIITRVWYFHSIPINYQIRHKNYKNKLRNIFKVKEKLRFNKKNTSLFRNIIQL